MSTVEKVKVLSVSALANDLHTKPGHSSAGYYATLDGIRTAVEGNGGFADLVTREDGSVYLETPCGGLSFRDPPRFSYVAAASLLSLGGRA